MGKFKFEVKKKVLFVLLIEVSFFFLTFLLRINGQVFPLFFSVARKTFCNLSNRHGDIWVLCFRDKIDVNF